MSLVIVRFARSQVVPLLLLAVLVTMLSRWSTAMLSAGQTLLPSDTLAYATVAAAPMLQGRVTTGRSRFDATAVQLSADGPTALPRLAWAVDLTGAVALSL